MEVPLGAVPAKGANTASSGAAGAASRAAALGGRSGARADPGLAQSQAVCLEVSIQPKVTSAPGLISAAPTMSHGLDRETFAATEFTSDGPDVNPFLAS